eukprot:TRINITY_DN384_c0_g1::TRINITY_DN384_c0_g1_i1::g.7531::m.7531 TRINITY_DN384_c0_g1::TRINITY_DN384_c0_g1_i1::g.7531  ORF type:complete len:250 (+),score=14.46 TRINITY_DN384_c0_g1_i1:39-788(+)
MPGPVHLRAIARARLPTFDEFSKLKKDYIKKGFAKVFTRAEISLFLHRTTAVSDKSTRGLRYRIRNTPIVTRYLLTEPVQEVLRENQCSALTQVVAGPSFGLFIPKVTDETPAHLRLILNYHKLKPSEVLILGIKYRNQLIHGCDFEKLIEALERKDEHYGQLLGTIASAPAQLLSTLQYPAAQLSQSLSYNALNLLSTVHRIPEHQKREYSTSISGLSSPLSCPSPISRTTYAPLSVFSRVFGHPRHL